MEITLDSVQCRDFGVSSKREWLVTNGIGGYASSTVAGANTRRYHGLLVSALEPPTDRYVLLSKVEEQVQINNQEYLLSCNQYPNAVYPQGYLHLLKFKLSPVPTWEYALPGDSKLIKRVWMEHGKNTTYITYELLGTKPVRLMLSPLTAYKFYHQEMNVRSDYPLDVTLNSDNICLTFDTRFPNMQLLCPEAVITRSDVWYYQMEHLREAERGLDRLEDLYNPAVCSYYLSPGDRAVFTATTDEIADNFNIDEALNREKARLKKLIVDSELKDPITQSLVTASDAFVVECNKRKTVIAGYHWFGDWGRDTMIALPGLCLTTKRYDIAKDILLTYAKLLNNGLLPNRFTDSSSEPEYNSIDAVLWFANAAYLYYLASGDNTFPKKIVPYLKKIVLAFQKGTVYNIHVDDDGLLVSGESGVQLTWMDAKVGSWVVTPRIGKPVEVNALWINLLRILICLSDKEHLPSSDFELMAAKAEKSFTTKFWYGAKGYYYDVIGDNEPDPSLRPNQLLAISLPFGPATRDQAISVLDVVQAHLLTPYGMRTLAPSDPSYIGHYGGTQETRDGAYHQGTVWPWLLGPFIEAYVRVTGDRPGARRMLMPMRQHLREAGMGYISEIFSGDPPYEPAGCIAQAWSVSEILRIWVDVLGNK